ncbi:serine/threonine-protein kinase [Actinomadura chokoriensis]|uniref:serine/threonine-protein kinase n=1 Tax=Actinomadura chokoriensis TaxID=454156 RepID=UPI0031FA3E7E
MEPLRQDDPREAGPYRLEGRLGGGGMGRVFLGRSRGGRRVAVKLIRPEFADDPGFRRRFALEAEAARRVGGFYTAQVVGADPDADPPWLVTAYIPGPSLQQAVAAHGPLPAETVAVLGAGLAEGLTAIHACDLVHRDLKPSNVILAGDGPRVIDFGISRALDATSHTHAVVGTPGFMSPEQARGRPVGPASDVFSLACVLAYAAGGRGPFGAGPGEAIVYRIVHDEPDLTGLPASLADLVRRCLAKDPGARPGLCDVLDDLSDVAQATPEWLPPPVTTMVTERMTQAPTSPPPPAPAAMPSRLPQPATPQPPPPEAQQPVSQATPRPVPQVSAAPRAAEVPEHGGSATGAISLALLCLPGILFMIFKGATMMQNRPFPDGYTAMLLVNIMIAMAEGAVLAAGVRLLLRRSAAGRWMIAGAGGVTAVHGAAAVVQFFMTGGTFTNVDFSVLVTMLVVAPSLAVCAGSAVVMALRPATGRWCLPGAGPPPAHRGAHQG